MNKTSLSCFLILFSLSNIFCFQTHKIQNTKAGHNVKPQIPERPTSWVSDFEGIFSANEVAYLDSIISLHEKETTNEIAIVTYKLNSNQIRSADEFDAFSLALFNQWEVGKKGKNNGLGIIISENLRKVRIEVGKGLVSKLSDPEAKEIIDSVFVPNFKNARYFKGISEGLELIIKKIK